MRDTRIQKVMSEAGLCSRRAAEQIIAEKRVTINGRIVVPGDKMDTKKDLLAVDGKNIYIPKKIEHLYVMLNKPRGYVTTLSDERGRKAVTDLLTGIDTRLYPVGRLDKDSEGLLLFTNDGEFSNLLMHPSHGVAKTYRVTVTPHAMEEKIIALTDGVVLDDGTKTKPAVIRVITDEPERTVLELTIKEGKNRQIRRMCEAVGLQVARLKRTQVGPVKLGMLKPGAYRMLAQQEVNALVASATKTTAKMESLAKAEAVKGEAVKRNFGKGKKPSEFPSRNTFKKPTKRNEKK